MSYFVHAPITKSIIFITGFLSVLANSLNLRQTLELDKEGLSKFELWRLITSRFLFLGTSEIICGLILLYMFRIFERQMGSRKYGAFVVLSFFVSTFLESILLLFYLEDTVSFSGPYFLIFAELVQYFYDIPSLAPISFFGNDKLFGYFFALQLFFSQYPPSGYLALCGIVAGLLYRVEFLGLEKFEFPKSIAKICQTYVLPLLNMSPTTLPRPQQYQLPQNSLNGRPSNTFEFEGGSGNYYTFPQPVRQPSVRNVDALINMGIDRETAVQTLVRYNDELQLAIESLMPTM